MRILLWLVRGGLLLAGSGWAMAAVEWTPLGELRQGARMEWRLGGLPAVSNVFDPAVMAVDAEFTEPGGGVRRVPAFWYRPYRNAMQGGTEVLTPNGDGEWRVRHFTTVPGRHAVRVWVSLQGSAAQEAWAGAIEVLPSPGPSGGPLRIAPGGQFFETPDGRPVPLVGANTCWHGSRGTFDYEAWFPAMAAAGWNWGRLWMAPWAFGIETAPEERLAYRLDRAWQLDRVFELAERHGIRLLLCLDYHGMFETEPDFWGSNNFWMRHPYRAANGGPCATQREFFTLAAARELYQKRVRYLVARYGASPSLFAWQFFNEIDNVYRHLDAGEVARWHEALGAWLKANDPWGHLVTTSLTGGSDRPEIWSLPALDFAVYHSYGEVAPATRLAAVADSMRARYGKPVVIGEFGVDFRGWSKASDPFLRGFRQLLWGGIAGGTAGTSMSWWWESIHADDVYPLYRHLTGILAGTGWGRGRWERVQAAGSGPAPDRVGEPVAAGEAFQVQLVTDGSWGGRPSGRLAVANPQSAAEAPKRLNAFVHGGAHPDLRTPFALDAWLGAGARLVLHLNSVSDGAVLSVRAGGVNLLRRSLPNKDGAWTVNNEYNEDVVVELPAGHQTIEVRNLGGDWFYLDWVRLEGVLPATYAGDWKPSPAVTAVRRDGEVLAYVVAAGFEYPSGATVTNPPSAPAEITLLDLPAGEYAALWFRTADGVEAGRGGARTEANGALRLTLPGLADDLVGHVFTPPTLRAGGFDRDRAFRMRLEGRRPEAFGVEASDDARRWTAAEAVRFEAGPPAQWVDKAADGETRRFYRLRMDGP